MCKDDLTDLFEKVLKEGDGEAVWRAFNPHLPFDSGEASNLFNDPHFVQELDRFIIKNRLTIGTAHIRHKLRMLLSELKKTKQEGPIRKFQMPLI